jgi:hypothetical protein
MLMVGGHSTLGFLMDHRNVGPMMSEKKIKDTERKEGSRRAR